MRNLKTLVLVAAALLFCVPAFAGVIPQNFENATTVAVDPYANSTQATDEELAAAKGDYAEMDVDVTIVNPLNGSISTNEVVVKLFYNPGTGSCQQATVDIGGTNYIIHDTDNDGMITPYDVVDSLVDQGMTGTEAVNTAQGMMGSGIFTPQGNTKVIRSYSSMKAYLGLAIKDR